MSAAVASRWIVLATLAGCATQPPTPPFSPLPQVSGYPAAPEPPRPSIIRLPQPIFFHPPPEPVRARLCVDLPSAADDELLVALDACGALQRRVAPRASVTVRLTLRVASSGNVASVRLEPDGDLPASVLGCLTQAGLSRSPFTARARGEVFDHARAEVDVVFVARDAREKSPAVTQPPTARCWEP